ncbi:MATE family efflux transporter [Marinobacter alexandrii]|uniref:MATE family efflux transporter n=1 Tax=Marinobacter alexandrii TaxID=2570351 RepID=UPI003299F1A8
MPMVIGVAAMMSIGLVDAFFVGQLGSVELAAISFIFPVAVALSSLGIGVMVGINSVVARAIGEGDDEKAQRRANFGMLFALAAGIIMGLSLIALLDPIFALMNAPAEVLPLIRDYMIPFALGFPLTMMTMGFNGVLRAQGEARKASYISLTFAGANWILDPILITGAFGFAGFGISGAAYATIIGWAIGVTLALYLLRSTSIPFDPKRLKGVRPFESMSAILRVGVPAACANAINPLGLTILTALAANEGQAAVAGFGAAGRLQSFAVVPLLALSGSIGAIVGQNWGAERYDRAREAALYAGGFCVVWGLGIAIAMISAGEWFADFFTEDPAVIAEFALYLQIAAWGYAGFGLLIVANGILNAVDKAMFALLQSFARVFLVMLPIAWMLQADWGSPAIYSAELAANLFGAVTAILIVGIVLRTNSAVYQRMPGG